MRWMHALLVLIALSSCDHTYQDESVGGPLVIYGTTDKALFRPVIDDFRQLHPGVKIRYDELEAGPLFHRFLAEETASQPQADLLLSSAMDLQVKLVNDGFAATHESKEASQLPAWANWRDEAFGFTFEPVVMVYNRHLMAGRNVPQTRSALLDELRANQPFWQGRIGTYDVVDSSVGYFIASQDARYSSDFGALIEAFRDAGAQRRSTTATLLDDIATGKLVLGYNLLGSYAEARAQKTPVLKIVHPQDYTLAVSRTAVIPKSAQHPRAAHVFLEYLLSPRGQRVLTYRSNLIEVRPQSQNTSRANFDPVRPIPLGPGLLVYLDHQKRSRMLNLFGATESVSPPVGPQHANDRVMTD